MEAGSVFLYSTPFRPIPLYGQRSAFDFSRYSGMSPTWQGFLPPSPWKLNEVGFSTPGTPSHLAAYNFYLHEHIKRLQEASLPKLFENTPPLPVPPRLGQGHSETTNSNEEIRKSQMPIISPSSQKEESNTKLTASFSDSYGSQYNIGRKLFPCPQCRYTTDRRNNLKRHMLTMHQTCSKLLECCGILFSTKASLREHSMIFHYHGYTCFYCGRRFCRKALLKRHLSVHNGQKDFVCSVCDYATSHKSNLERHRKVHLRQDDATEELASDKTSYVDGEIKNEETASNEDYNGDISVCSDSEEEEINVHTD